MYYIDIGRHDFANEKVYLNEFAKIIRGAKNLDTGEMLYDNLNMKNGIDYEEDRLSYFALKLTKYIVMHEKPEFKVLHDGDDPNADRSILIKPPAWPHHNFTR